jgi:hypothetical protein
MTFLLTLLIVINGRPAEMQVGVLTSPDICRMAGQAIAAEILLDYQVTAVSFKCERYGTEHNA